MARSKKQKKAAEATAKTRTRDAAETPWQGAGLVEVPDEQSPVNAKQPKWRKRYRLLAWASLIGMPIVLVVDLSLATKVMDPNFGSAAVQVADQVDSVGKATAWLTMQKWLSGDPSPLPGATVVSWDGFSTKSQDKSVSQQVLQAWGEKDYTVEMHRFTLVDKAGQVYEADVTVAVDGNGQSEAVGTPSAFPVAPSSSGWSTKGPWMDTVETTKTDAMSEAVNNWAKAYTSGDSATLRLAVGDQDASHTYMTLAKVGSVSTIIQKAAYKPTLKDKTYESQQNPSTVIAQVEMKVSWDGQDPREVDSKGQKQTLDVLIENANTASPRVVAWGATGTGPDLEPYQNAVTGRQIKKDAGQANTQPTQPAQAPTDQQQPDPSAPMDAQ